MLKPVGMKSQNGKGGGIETVDSKHEYHDLNGGIVAYDGDHFASSVLEVCMGHLSHPQFSPVAVRVSSSSLSAGTPLNIESSSEVSPESRVDQI